jgi:lipoyl(octanoyl) transferase
LQDGRERVAEQMTIRVVDLGRISYPEALDLQNQLLCLRQQNRIGDVLLLLEHADVLTIGRSGHRSNLLLSEEEQDRRGVRVYDINRGGDITYHGPGQIVGYPIIDLSSMGKSIRTFVRNLEEVFIRLLNREYHIPAGRDPVHTGVWIGEKKITAIGLAVKHWVTQHGFAFNVNTDLSRFQWIVPCGIADKGVTSMADQLGRTVDLLKVKDLVADYFGQVFQMETEAMEKQQLYEVIQGEGAAWQSRNG